MNKSISILGLVVAMLFIVIACEDETMVRQDALVNYEVDLLGDWSVFSVTRNGMDISSDLNYASFSLKLEDGSFSLSGVFPFPTLGQDMSFSSGTWEFNDDFAPTQIHFINGGDRVPVTMTFPAFGLNNTSLGLKFALGCTGNEYIYQFKKQ